MKFLKKFEMPDNFQQNTLSEFMLTMPKDNLDHLKPKMSIPMNQNRNRTKSFANNESSQGKKINFN